jgi:excisionase family DNA binding protein
METLLTAEQLSDLLKVQLSTIYQWTHTGFVPYVKVGRLIRFRESAIKNWLAKRENRGRSRRKTRVSLVQRDGRKTTPTSVSVSPQHRSNGQAQDEHTSSS